MPQPEMTPPFDIFNVTSDLAAPGAQEGSKGGEGAGEIVFTAEDIAAAIAATADRRPLPEPRQSEAWRDLGGRLHEPNAPEQGTPRVFSGKKLERSTTGRRAPVGRLSRQVQQNRSRQR